MIFLNSQFNFLMNNQNIMKFSIFLSEKNEKKKKTPRKKNKTMSGDWRTGLCDCMSHGPSCLDSLFCLPCQSARQCEAVKGNRDSSDCTLCVVGCVLLPIQPLFSCQIRGKVVDKYKLDEGCLGGFVKGCCCFPCSTCQAHRELSLRGDWPSGFYTKEPMVMN